MMRNCRLPASSAQILEGSVVTPTGVQDFFKGARGTMPGQYYILKEQMVYCPEHRFRGRFDYAVLRLGEVPVLVMVVERKFPVDILPTKGRPEDFFQAALYSLAFASHGVDCGSTSLLLIYCRQVDASHCAKRSSPAQCVLCSKSRTFRKRYGQVHVLSALRRLDEVWYSERPPRPSPAPGKCIRCNYGKSGQCKYSVR